MGRVICSHCGSTRGGERYTPGWAWGLAIVSLFILWPLLVLAAVAGRERCVECRAEGSLLPVHTPRGRKLLEEAGHDPRAYIADLERREEASGMRAFYIVAGVSVGVLVLAGIMATCTGP